MLTRRGLVLLAVAAILSLVGFTYQVEEFVLLGLAASACVVVGLVLAVAGVRWQRHSVRVDVERVAGRLLVGHRADVTVSVTNVGRSGMFGVVLDLAGKWHVSYPGLPGGRGRQQRLSELTRSTSSSRSLLARPTSLLAPHPLVPLPDVPPGARWSSAIEVPTTVRGLLTLDALGVWYSDPLGLVALRATTGPPVHVVVCPDPGGSFDGATPPAAADEARGHFQFGVAAPRVEGDELSGLRAYVPGDRITRLHWPAVAKTGDLMVRHFVELEVRRVEVTVDVRPGYLERSIRLAAVLGGAALDSGSPVMIRTTGGEELAVEPGADAKTTFLQALAVIGPASKR